MWTKELFKVEKPIIALLHLRALPGDPLFGGSMNAVIEKAREELNALQDGGVDGILIANEFSLPYEKKGIPCYSGSYGTNCGRAVKGYQSSLWRKYCFQSAGNH